MTRLASALALSALLAAGVISGPSLAAMPDQAGQPQAGPGATAPRGEMIANLPGDALTIADYYNQNVYDNQDNKIGDVNDILLDRDGKVGAVIVGVGGFLGAGEKNVAVPFNALKVQEKNGKRYLVMDTTKEALQSAPGYTYDRNKTQWVPATRQG